MSNKKICVTCKAENEASFKYCRSCGAVLQTVDDATSKDEAVFEATSGFNSSAATIDGISEEHLRVYIGKNHHRILNSFFNMSLFKKKTSFCLPVLILGFLFGFLGISFWFFYRKMNKIGFLFLGLSLLFPFVNFVLNFDTFSTLSKELSALFSSAYMMEQKAFSLEFERILNDFTNTTQVFMPQILNLAEYFIMPIVMSVFALFFYKNKALNDINRLSSLYSQDANFTFRLFLAGGTSGARVLIPILIMLGFFILLYLGLIALLV